MEIIQQQQRIRGRTEQTGKKTNKEKVNLLGKYEISLRTNLSIFHCAGQLLR